MKLKPFLITLLTTLMSVQVVFGQTCCTGGAPLTGALNIRTMTSNAWGVSLSYNINMMEDLVQGTNKIKEDNVTRETQALLAQIDYGITKNLTATILLPYVWLNQTTNTVNGSSLESTAGIGDILFLSQYGKILPNQAVIVFGGGVKVPTGATKNTDDETGFILPANLQPGTGSVDFLASAQYQTSFNFRRSFKFTQTFNVRFNTTSTDLTFHDTYRFGNVFQSFSVFADQFLIRKVLQTPSLTFSYRYSTHDIIEGSTNDNTGGHWLYFGPGWAINVTPSLLLGVVGEIPLYRNLNGLQITTSQRWMFTIQFLLSKQKDL